MTPLTLSVDGDRHIVVVRRFAASPEAVYRLHIEPASIRQWMLGRAG